MAAIQLKALPPVEAIEFFRAKGFQIAFSWQDVWGDEHARAFTVAKAMRLDVLRDIREAVDSAIADGTTLVQFQKDLTPILQAKGWWGRQLVTDPLGGRRVRAQLGSPRRLRTIFDTNVRSAHAAGKWERIQRTKGRLPFLRYSAVLDTRTRPKHRAWHGTVLPVDDPWWDTHFPPNGWHCRCQPQQFSQDMLDAQGFEPTPRPRSPARRHVNNRTGEITRVPDGIDPGFAHNIGKASVRGLVPPERPGILPTPFRGDPVTVAMPPPRPAGPDRILPAGLAAGAYLDRFLGEFGATQAKPRVFTDVIGEPVVIDAAMFTDRRGRSRIKKRGRERNLLLLADAIKSPDEIWWQWEEFPKGRRTLLRRYLARFVVEGEDTPTFALFDVSKDGWRGVTTFNPGRVRYLMNQRGGALAYRRDPEE